MARLLSGLLPLLLLAATGFASTIRVTTWNLQPGATASGTEPDARIAKDAAELLTKLGPDIILLQGVSGRPLCDQIALALKPADYNVVICSSFLPVSIPASNPLQVAILSKHQASFSWSEPWQSPGELRLPGGFAFAALQIGDERMGIFSAQMGEQQLPALAAQQLLEQVDRVKHGEPNRAESFLIGCTFGSASKASMAIQERLFHFLSVGGFEDLLKELPVERKITLVGGPAESGGVADFILVNGIELSVSPEIMTTSISGHLPLTCSLELSSPSLAFPQTAHLEMAKEQTLPRAAAPVDEPRPLAVSIPLPGIAARELLWCSAILPVTLLALFALSCVQNRRKRLVAHASPAPRPASRIGADTAIATTARTVIVAPHSITGSAGDAERSSPPQQVIQIEPRRLTGTQSMAWRQSALPEEKEDERSRTLLRESLVAQLTLWLKQKLVRKLLVDRAQLLEAQEQATRTALNVDQRLTRLELQIQQQYRAYERRIEELNRQLLAAKEESRTLIRARIAQIKVEMETARSRMVAEAKEKNGLFED